MCFASCWALSPGQEGAGVIAGGVPPGQPLVPMAFVDMGASTAGDVAFSARGGGCTILLTHDGISLRSPVGAVGLRFLGTSAHPQIDGLMPQPGYSNYLFGKDPSKWRMNAVNYSRVRYGALYSGVDVVYYGNQRQLEYDLVVAPGASPKAIVMKFDGGDRLRLSPDGDLALSGELRLLKPRAYQEIEGVRKEIPSRYVLKGRNRVAFALGRYDHSLPLVIDPVLSYATFLGGSSDEAAYAVATDSSGNSYVAGYTTSADFPATTGAYKSAYQGGDSDVFVAKYSPAGALIYATYMGGSGDDTAYGIAVDSSNDAYITGYTTSTDFPTTAGAYQAAYKGGASEAFVAELNAAGNALFFSTYLGGSGDDIGYAVALAPGNEATVTGFTDSSDFPTSTGAYRTSYGGGISDAFVTRLSAAGTALVYSTYLGGSGEDLGYGVAVDSASNTYVTGYTQSSDFPTTVGAVQIVNAGGYDAFVTALNPTGTARVYSTFLGGSQQDYGVGIAVDSQASAYIAGYTASSDYPHTSGALQPAKGSGYDAVVTKLTSSGTIAYSTFLGGNGDDYGMAIAVDANGNAYVTGDTDSTNFPTTPDAAQSTATGSFDAFVARVDATGAALGYSTYLGGSGFQTGYGIALDSLSGADVAGYTVSSDFPVTAGSAQSALAGGSDAFVARIALNKNVTYLTGDVAPYTSDVAPNFGDGVLNILDLIQELFAVNNVPGFKPGTCSDRLDAMDLFPADTATTRGGDGALDIRDLILELFRVNNLDPARPLRISLGGKCASGGSSVETSRETALQQKPQARAQGVLVRGTPEQSNNGEERVPVYLAAVTDLVHVAVTFGLGDERSQLRFVPTAETPPSLAQDGQLGAVAAAWLEGVTVRVGERLLLGYVTGPTGMSANLRVFGVSASGLDDNREVRLDAPTAGGLRQ